MNNTKKTPGRIAFESFRDALKIPSKTFIWDDVQTKQAYEAAAFAVLTSQWRPMTEPPANDHHVIVVSDDYTDCQAVLFSLHGQTRRFWMDVPPLPQEPTDPYAELKAAHAAGKVIQTRSSEDHPWIDWCVFESPLWNDPVEKYRIKPWTLSHHLPGFRPLEPGEEWQPLEWSEDDLLEGYRPLLVVEFDDKTYDDIERLSAYGWSKGEWRAVQHEITTHRFRTRRPLPPTKQEREITEFETTIDSLGFKFTDEKLRDWMFKGWQAARATAKPNP